MGCLDRTVMQCTGSLQCYPTYKHFIKDLSNCEFYNSLKKEEEEKNKKKQQKHLNYMYLAYFRNFIETTKSNQKSCFSETLKTRKRNLLCSH